MDHWTGFCKPWNLLPKNVAPPVHRLKTPGPNADQHPNKVTNLSPRNSDTELQIVPRLTLNLTAPALWSNVAQNRPPKNNRENGPKPQGDQQRLDMEIKLIKGRIGERKAYGYLISCNDFAVFTFSNKGLKSARQTLASLKTMQDLGFIASGAQIIDLSDAEEIT